MLDGATDNIVRPGHFNAVAVSAFSTIADDNIKSVAPGKRNCRFSDENNLLKLFNEYSQASCFLECKLFYAQKQMNTTCTPWNFPFANNDQPNVCDPWLSVEIMAIMKTKTPKGQCKDCLADCNHIIYQSSLSAQPLKDDNSLDSFFPSLCSLDVNDTKEKDIAILSVYIDKPTLLQFETQASQNWVQFLSNVGGILGLCIGLSIVSIVEISWIFICIIARVFKLSERMHRIWQYIKVIRRNNKTKVNNEVLILD